MANRYATRRKFYTWSLLSEDGQPVAAWNGVTVAVDSELIPLNKNDTLIVCAGERAARASTPKILNWLRRETRKGMDFGALSSGTYTLALAGLVGGRRVTTHWEYYNALTELLPDVDMQNSIYTVDGRVFHLCRWCVVHGSDASPDCG